MGLAERGFVLSCREAGEARGSGALRSGRQQQGALIQV